MPKAAKIAAFFFGIKVNKIFNIIRRLVKNINAKPKIKNMEEKQPMRRKAGVILALVLVFALIFTACATRRPLQTPTRTGQNNATGYNYNRGTGTGTTTGTRTNTGTYNGMGPSSNNPYDLGYGTGNNAGAGNNPGYGGYGATGSSTGYGGYGTTGTGTGYGGYGGTGTTGNYGGAGTTYNNNGGTNGFYGGGATGVGNPVYYGGYGGYGGYNQGMYGGYGNDYRNVGGSNNSPNYGFNNTGANTGTTAQADGIARSIEQMAGVDNATVVVNGNTAYVGIDTDGDLTGRNISYGNATGLDAVKRSCAQRVKSADPKIQTVYVSTDANFFERLRRVETGVKSGNPISNFRNELSTLIRGLTPTRQ